MDTSLPDVVMSISMPPIELPEVQITAAQSKPSVFSCDPLPPRSTSPPLPPRRNPDGLPPRYLIYLRRLLRQWLEQQLRAEDDGLPGQERQRLWDDKRVKELEQVLWESVVLPRRDGQRAGLLRLDWNAWALGAAERKRLWRDQKRSEPTVPPSSSVKDVDQKITKAPQKRGSTSDAEPPTSASQPRLSASTSHPATPDRRSPRPPSVTSTLKDGPSKLRNVDNAENDVQEEGETVDETERQEAWNRSITSLRGYEALPKGYLPVEDDEDTLTSSSTTDRFPGAFPHNQDGRRPKPPPKDTMASLGLPEPPEEQPSRIIKPVFCLYFPSPTTSNTSSSSLLLHRTSSVASTIRRRQLSSSGKWWPTGTGSQRSWTGLSTGSFTEDPVAAEYVPGKFSLPSPASPSRRPSTLKARPRKKQADPSDDSPPVGSPASVTITEEEDGSDSETELAGSRIRKPRDVSLIIGGGQDDVPDHSVTANECRLVGGTIVVSGLNRNEDQQALAITLRALLYTIYAMTVELELLDAFRVPREPNVSDDALAPSLPPKTPTISVGRRRSIKDKGDKTKGFFNRLGRDTKGIFGNLLPRPRRDSIPETRPPPGMPPSGPHTPHSALSLPMSTPSTGNAFDPSTPPISQTTDRHLRILQRLEAMLPSTSPGLTIPMPSLLLRVREEDRIRREKAKQEVEEGSIVENRSFFLASGSGTTNGDLKGRAMGYRMGGDVRAGLGALIHGMDTFEGWVRLQRLDILSCSGPDDTAVGLCEAPKANSAVFWEDSTDQTIEDFALNSVGDYCSCGIKECKVDKDAHVRWLLHGQRRVGIKLKAIPTDSKTIDVWTKCVECEATTDPRALGDVARLYSFSKLLELLIYEHPLQPNVCKHTDPAHVPRFLRYIRGPAGILMLYVEPITVLDTRLPKLQVGPNVGKRKPGLANAEAAISSLTSRERKESQSEELKEQINAVFEVLLARLGLLQRYIQAERDTGPADEMEKREAEGTSVDPLSKAEESLASLLQDVQYARTVLLELCSNHPATQLNDIRQKLEQAIHLAQDKMSSWQKDNDVPEDFKDLPLNLPDYLANDKIHAPPGSSILIREDEPSSVFAYALSSLPYFVELANGHKPAPPSDPTEGTVETLTDLKSDKTEWAIEVKRRDAPRDLLSLRALTKKRSEVSMGKLDAKAPMTPKPNQPSLELSLEQVEGTMSKSSLLEPTSRPRSPSNSESETGSATPRVVSSRMTRRISDSEHHSSAPPSSFRPSTMRSVSHTVPPSPKLGASIPPSPASRPRTPETAKESWSSSVTGSLTSSFNTLLRIGSDMGSIRMRGGDRALTSLIGPLSMMSAMDNSLSPQAVLDKPHLQLTYTLEDRLKIGCTIYYATAFDSLRRRCAIDRSMISSLARCDPWEAQGGKSKASFFMTRDKRYIVKQLVSKWNVSDTQALLEIAPVYFEHLAGTHNRATALTKIVGFYTFKLNDLKNGQKTSMDLLVMENLFYKQDIAQRFDLKGIEGRKAPKGSEAGIQFDSEWLEGQAKSPILLYPHAKRILQEAISLDTRFLSRESIMDYSLLLGLDANKKELVVGLVDAIGSYNLFKNIESRGKLALTRGGEVTIIPPDQYRERFENAIRQYFIACPDKWSKTSRRNPTMTDTLPATL